MLHGHQHVRYREGGAAMKTKQKTFVFASLFADDIQGMVEYKAALGHKCESYAWALQTFDRYCLSHHPDSGTLTQEIAFGFCQAGTDGKNCGYRAGTVREFGRYLSAIGKEAYIR